MKEELPTPPQIAECPELAVLAVLEFTLDGCVRALVAAHPELDSTEQPCVAACTAQYALRILAQIWRLKHDLERYRHRALEASSVGRDTKVADDSW